jgi:hypothetical protein
MKKLLDQRFSPETLTEHRLFKTPVWKHIRTAKVLVVLSVPLIYACAIPFLILDFWITLYQSVCFPIYGIPQVRRRDYLIFDRGRLAYLNAIEKVGCVFCSYANGLLAYITEITGRTEQRFCPIQHDRPLVQPHSRYEHFVAYGDARTYRARSQARARAYGDLVARAK